MKGLLISKDFFQKSWGMRKVYGKYTLRIIGKVLWNWEVEDLAISKELQYSFILYQLINLYT
jgi:hypothetical protein